MKIHQQISHITYITYITYCRLRHVRILLLHRGWNLRRSETEPFQAVKSETENLWNFRTLAFLQVQFGHAGAQAAALSEHSCTPRENIKRLELLGQRQGRNSNGQERRHEGTPWRPPRNKKKSKRIEQNVASPDARKLGSLSQIPLISCQKHWTTCAQLRSHRSHRSSRSISFF